MVLLDRNTLNQMFEALAESGFTVIGPTVRDNAIVLDRLESIEDLPAGWTDDQERGAYRLKQETAGAFFNFTNGPHSWKRYLYPPQLTLFNARRRNGDIELIPEKPTEEKFAFIGVRPCDLAAIGIHDRIFLKDHHVDTDYRERRKNLFIVAVNCLNPGNTCFCTSMGTGPTAGSGYDLVLTELSDENQHHFLVDSGSVAGTKMLEKLAAPPAPPALIHQSDEMLKEAANKMGRNIRTDGLADMLRESFDAPYWQEASAACLSCGNCTMVCPTCFCATVEDVTDLTGETATRVRRWDSCFNGDFSYIHGGILRQSTLSRYRQWVTHKLSSWEEQFGSSGCVGCGRCITWCPVGIDLTEVVGKFWEKKFPSREKAPANRQQHREVLIPVN